MGVISNVASQPSQPSQRYILRALKDFVESHQVSNQDVARLHDTQDNALRDAMREHRRQWRITTPFLETIVNLAASLIEHAYCSHTFEERKVIALFNWYLIYCDDKADSVTEPFAVFESRFLRGKPQLDPVLDALADVLHMIFDLYPTFYANSIVNAVLQFINSLSIERELGESGGAPSSKSPDPQRFPWFLRHSTGISIGFALLIFPRSIPLESIPCFKAQADMDFWISATNDLLSFYKESIAGETTNYISNRAQAESKPSLDVVSDLIDELRESRETIYNTLGLSTSPAVVQAWRDWERGYISWHFNQTARYKLNQLDREIF